MLHVLVQSKHCTSAELKKLINSYLEIYTFLFIKEMYGDTVNKLYV